MGGQHTGGLRGDNAACQCRLAGETHQVVRGGGEITREIDPREPPVTRFAKPTDRFYPAEADLFAIRGKYNRAKTRHSWTE